MAPKRAGTRIHKVLKQRIITAVILALAFIAATTLLNSFLFSLIIAFAVLVAAWEWGGFIGLSRQKSKLAYLATLAVMIMALFLFLGVSPQHIYFKTMDDAYYRIPR